MTRQAGRASSGVAASLAVAVAVAGGLASPRDAGAYAGIGRAAVEKALGRVPESEAELDGILAELETKNAGDDATAESLYQWAVLQLNRPKSLQLEGPRRHLADAVAVDPAFADALELWTDLIPGEAELRAEEATLRKREDAATSAPTRWAVANVLHLLGRNEDAAREAEEAERLDAAYHARALWLSAVMAGERKDDARATTLLGEALDALDEPAARLLWDSALLVANPEEIEHVKGLKGLASAELKDYLRGFWKRRDVFPLTDANERFGEHLRRVAKARAQYGLGSNGHAYFTMHDTFKELSPDLDYYGSDVVYDYQEKMPLWLDHRGLLYVRHGEPDQISRASSGMRSETWLYYRLTFRPLMFHLIDRRGIGEFCFTLNLAQAMANTTIEDDPKQILTNAGDFRDLYGTRATFHNLFQRVSVSRSRYEVEDLLLEEANLMAGFLKQGFFDDTNTLQKKENILPFAAYSATFRGEGGTVDAFVYYAIPDKELRKKPGALDFDSTIVIYASNWGEKVVTADHHFHYDRPAGVKNKEDLVVGVMQLHDLKPARYNFAFQVTEKSSGRTGIAKGEFVADFYGSSWVNLSDLVLADSVEPAKRPTAFERNGVKVVPIPTRTVLKGKKAEVYYEVYNLAPGEDGKSHYRVEYRILQIQRAPSAAEKALGIGMNVASIFFPYPVFLARAGLFGIDVATAGPTKGLEVGAEDRVSDETDRVAETFKFDTKKHPGIYQLYVTVKDYVTGSVTTRSVRFAITG